MFGTSRSSSSNELRSLLLEQAKYPKQNIDIIKEVQSLFSADMFSKATRWWGRRRNSEQAQERRSGQIISESLGDS
jgi:hypothetical protein